MVKPIFVINMVGYEISDCLLSNSKHVSTPIKMEVGDDGVSALVQSIPFDLESEAGIETLCHHLNKSTDSMEVSLAKQILREPSPQFLAAGPYPLFPSVFSRRPPELSWARVPSPV